MKMDIKWFTKLKKKWYFNNTLKFFLDYLSPQIKFDLVFILDEILIVKP
jgi:hypothetical protein